MNTNKTSSSLASLLSQVHEIDNLVQEIDYKTEAILERESLITADEDISLEDIEAFSEKYSFIKPSAGDDISLDEL